MSIISSGTTLNTAYTVTGDLTGNLIIQTNGTTEALRVDTNQNVGIGTANPAYKLDVSVVNTAPAKFSYTSGASLAVYCSASSASLSGVGDVTQNNLFAVNSSSNYAVVQTNGSERMRIDSSGNVGIGVTPTAKLHVYAGNVSTLGQVSNAGLAISGAGANGNYAQIGLGYAGTYQPATIGYVTTTQTGYTYGDLIFANRGVNTDTAPTERMRLDSGGNFHVGGSGQQARIVAYGSSDLFNGWNGSTKEFAVDSSGQIYARFTSISSLSDERAKENIQPMHYGLTEITKLKPVTFNFKSNPNIPVYGFVAQDVKDILPELVGEEKDSKAADGTNYLTLKMGDMLPVLTKAIQELKTTIDGQAKTIQDNKAIVDAQAKSISDLKALVDAQTKSISDLKALVDAQTKSNQDLKTLVTTQAADIAKLKSQNSNQR